MKLTRSSVIGVSSALLGALFVLASTHLNLWGGDNVPEIRVEPSPVNRDLHPVTSFAPIVKKAAPSVVNIYSTRIIKQQPVRNPFRNDPFFRQFFGDQAPGDDQERSRKEQSLGSGVIVSADGYILTANHVVADADEIKVSIKDSKKEYTARVVGRDQPTDVAVLKIQEHNLPAVTLADSDQIEVGDVVLAIGNPFGVGQTVTMGIVSALGRSGLGFNGYEDFIQTDAAINPGNSGGALVDAEGRLVGINTAIISRSGGYQGIGFAVPVNMARHVMDRLITSGKVTRGYLGIIRQDITPGLAEQFNLPDQNGALVGDVIPGTPAARAGLKSGDVIVAINDKPVTDANGLQLIVSDYSPGSAVAVKLIRNGVTKTFSVTLAELPSASASSDEEGSNADPGSPSTDALDGVTVADLEPQVRQQLHLPESIQGALVTEVDQDSNSAEAGLQANDVIVEINRQPVAGSDDAVRICKRAKGDQILVKIWRRVGNFSGTRYLSVDNTKPAK